MAEGQPARPTSSTRFRPRVGRETLQATGTGRSGPNTSAGLDLAQHLDTEFCDRFFRAGAYLPTHAEHLQRWH